MSATRGAFSGCFLFSPNNNMVRDTNGGATDYEVDVGTICWDGTELAAAIDDLSGEGAGLVCAFDQETNKFTLENIGGGDIIIMQIDLATAMGFETTTIATLTEQEAESEYFFGFAPNMPIAKETEWKVESVGVLGRTDEGKYTRRKITTGRSKDITIQVRHSEIDQFKLFVGWLQRGYPVRYFPDASDTDTYDHLVLDIKSANIDLTPLNGLKQYYKVTLKFNEFDSTGHSIPTSVTSIGDLLGSCIFNFGIYALALGVPYLFTQEEGPYYDTGNAGGPEVTKWNPPSGWTVKKMLGLDTAGLATISEQIDITKGITSVSRMDVTLVDDEYGTLALLFARDRQLTESGEGVTRVTADFARDDTTLYVADGGELKTAANYCYLGLETIRYTGKTATTVTGITREQYYSPACKITLPEKTSQYSPVEVSTWPRVWIDRGVELYAYAVDMFGRAFDDGFSVGTSIETYTWNIWNGQLEEAPYTQDGIHWVLSCDSIQKRLDREILSNQRKGRLALSFVNSFFDNYAGGQPTVQDHAYYHINESNCWLKWMAEDSGESEGPTTYNVRLLDDTWEPADGVYLLNQIMTMIEHTIDYYTNQDFTNWDQYDYKVKLRYVKSVNASLIQLDRITIENLSNDVDITYYGIDDSHNGGFTVLWLLGFVDVALLEAGKNNRHTAPMPPPPFAVMPGDSEICFHDEQYGDPNSDAWDAPGYALLDDREIIYYTGCSTAKLRQTDGEEYGKFCRKLTGCVRGIADTEPIGLSRYDDDYLGDGITIPRKQAQPIVQLIGWERKNFYTIFLETLMSRDGDGELHATYDTIDGGCAIPPKYVDYDRIGNFEDRNSTSDLRTMFIDEKKKAKDLFKEDWLFLGKFLTTKIINSIHQITIDELKQYEGAPSSPQVPDIGLQQLDLKHMPQLLAQSTNVVNHIQTKCGYDWGQKEWWGDTVDFIDPASVGEFINAHKTLKIENKGLLGGHGMWFIDRYGQAVSEFFGWHRLPHNRVGFSCSPVGLKLSVGSVGLLTAPNLPTAAGTIGWSSRPIWVESIKYRFRSVGQAAWCDVVAVELESGNFRQLAPSGKVTAWDGGTNKITLTQNYFTSANQEDIWGYGGVRDIDWFKAGYKIIMYNRGKWDDTDDFTITVVDRTNNQLTVTGSQSVAVGADTRIRYANWDDAHADQIVGWLYAVDNDEDTDYHVWQ